MPRTPSETLGKGFSITMLATRADLGTATHWISCNVRPFDSGLIAHRRSPDYARISILLQFLRQGDAFMITRGRCRGRAILAGCLMLETEGTTKPNPPQSP